MENENNRENPYVQRPGTDSLTPRPIPVMNGMAKAAMILGIISLISVFTFTVYPAMVLGSLAIILALLSKGKDKIMHGNARSGVILGTIALVGNLLLIVGSFYMIFTNADMQEQFNQVYESMYGQSFDEIMEGIQNGTIDYDDLYQ